MNQQIYFLRICLISILEPIYSQTNSLVKSGCYVWSMLLYSHKETDKRSTPEGVHDAKLR